MMLSQFRTFQLSVRFYKLCLTLKLPAHLRDQLLRASSSVSLNLAEGSAKPTIRDRMKFYHISLGSIRESQAILLLQDHPNTEAMDLADQLGAALYRLTHPRPQ